MSAKIGCDMHKNYSLFSIIDEGGAIGETTRVDHGGGSLKKFLTRLPEGSEVAVEACGGWYRVIDEMEEAGLEPTKRVKDVLESSEDQQRLRTAPGIGQVLSALILLEVGDVSRFNQDSHLASYAGRFKKVEARIGLSDIRCALVGTLQSGIVAHTLGVRV